MTDGSMTPEDLRKLFVNWIWGGVIVTGGGTFLLPYLFHKEDYKQADSHHNESMELAREQHKEIVELTKGNQREDEKANVPDIAVTNFGKDDGVTLVEVTNLSLTATAEITQTKLIVSDWQQVQKIRNTRLKPINNPVHDRHEEMEICLIDGRFETNPQSYVCVRNKAFRIPPGGKVELRICNHDPLTTRMDLEGKIQFSANQLRTFSFDGFKVGPNTRY